MKKKQATTMMTLVLAIVAMAFLATPAVAEDDHAYRIAPPGSNAYGKTLTDWLSVYWRWYYGSGADPAQSFIGHVKLMPLPAGEYISGAGTPDDPALYRGYLEITLRPGTPFVLPLAAWTVERYNNGNPDDPSIPKADFLAGVSPSLYIDGRSVVSDSNKAAFYVPLTTFDPIVIYPAPTSYNSYAVVAFQGFGIVSPPLSVGRHVIHLYEPYIIRSAPLFIGQIYDNTWIVTVAPH